LLTGAEGFSGQRTGNGNIKKGHLITLRTTTGGVDIPDGAYLATEIKIEKQAATANSPDDSDWLKWYFTVYNCAEGTEMTATSSMRFGPQSKTRQWAEALEGKKFAPDE
jgi:hypothetical protein